MKVNIVQLHFKNIFTMFLRNQYLVILKKVATIPLLDYLLTQGNSASVIEYGRLVIAPIKMLSLYHKNIEWRQKFRPFADFYRSDLRCYKALEAYLNLWETYWLNDTSYYPDNISPTLKSIDFKSSSNIKVCLRIWEHYLWLFVSDHFSPWGGWKLTLAVQWYQKVVSLNLHAYMFLYHCWLSILISVKLWWKFS